MSGDPRSDPFLSGAQEVEGFKILYPVVITSKLGQGGMGSVYRGRHVKLDIDVAVKCLRPGLVTEDEEFVARFRREATVAASIDSENLVRVFDVHESRGLHYLVMEYVEGETIRERIKRSGPVESLAAAVTVIYDAARGLSQAHERGIVHRDIKPDNIMIADDGRIKVMDLGLAKVAASLDEVETRTGLVMGTPNYMPPEQYSDAKNLKPAADVYSLALTLYYLLTGRHAVEKGALVDVMRRVCQDPLPDLAAARPDVSDGLLDFFLAATNKAPETRPADAARVMELLAPYRSRRGRELLARSSPTDRGGTEVSSQTLANIRNAIQDTGESQSIPGTMPPGHGATIPPTMPPQARPAATASGTPAAAPARGGRAPLVLLSVLVILAGGFGAWKLGWLGTNSADTEKLFQEGVADVRRPATLDRGVTTLLKVKEDAPDHAGLDEELRPALLVLGKTLLDDGDLHRAYEMCREALAIRSDEAAASLQTRVKVAIRAALKAALTITEPKSGRLVKNRKISVAGRVDLDRLFEFGLDESRLEILGKKVKIRGGEFRTDVELRTEGKQLLPVQIEAFEGVVHARMIEFPSDFAPPELTVQTPEPGAFVAKNPVTFSGSFKDATQCKVVAAIEGPSKMSAAASNGLKAGDATSWLILRQLKDGRYEAKVTVTDAAGRSHSRLCKFTVDTTKPVLHVGAPPANVTAGTYRWIGRIEDANLERVTVAGKKIDVDRKGNFATSVALKSGKNTLEIVARDRAGNESRESHSITRETAESNARAARPLIALVPDLAVKMLDRALDIDSGSIEARLLRGLAHLASREPESALQDFSTLADSRETDCAAARAGRAAVRWWMEAEANYAKGAEALAPGSQDVRADLIEATRQAPKKPVGPINLVTLEIARKDWAAAEAAAREIDASVKRVGVLENNLGYADLVQGRHRDAVAHFDQAIRENEKLGQPWLNRAVAKLALGDAADARRDWGRAIELGRGVSLHRPTMPWPEHADLESDRPSILITLEARPPAAFGEKLVEEARALHLRGDHEKAAILYGGVPSPSAQAMIWRIEAMLAHGKSDLTTASLVADRCFARRDLTEAQRRQVRRLRAITLYERGQSTGFFTSRKKSIEWLTRALKDLGRSEIRLARARHYLSEKDYRKAKADLDIVLKRSPSNSLALRLRSRVHTGLKDVAASKRDASASLRLYPRQPALKEPFERWFVVLHKGRSRMLRYWTDPGAWPSPPSKTDARCKSEGYFIRNIGRGKSQWAVFEEKASGFEQVTHVAKTFPRDWIKKQWDASYRVETAGWNGSEHVVVMRKGTLISKLQQSYRADSTFPTTWLREKAKEGFFLDAVWPTSKTQQTYLLNKQPGKKAPPQSWLASGAFPHSFLRDKRKLGQHPTILSHDGSKWRVVTTQDTSVTDHRILSSKTWPKEQIKKAWGENYYLVAAAEGTDFPAPSPYSLSAYAMFDRQDWKSAGQAIYAQARADNGNQLPYLLLRRMLIALRTGNTISDVRQLAAFYRAQSRPTLDPWSRTLMNFFARDVTEEALLRIAGTDREKLCEAYYYAAAFRQAAKDVATAKRYLQKCLDQKVETFTEHTSAKVELSRLK